MTNPESHTQPTQNNTTPPNTTSNSTIMGGDVTPVLSPSLSSCSSPIITFETPTTSQLPPAATTSSSSSCAIQSVPIGSNTTACSCFKTPTSPALSTASACIPTIGTSAAASSSSGSGVPSGSLSPLIAANMMAYSGPLMLPGDMLSTGSPTTIPGLNSLSTSPSPSLRTNSSGSLPLTSAVPPCAARCCIHGIADLPCARGVVYTPSDPSRPSSSSVTWKWSDSPRTILIIKKPSNEQLVRVFVGICSSLLAQGITVIVERAVCCEELPRSEELLSRLGGQKLRTWIDGEDLAEKVDLIVCLGGDGTLLWAQGIFPKRVPPMVCFRGGTLGFLTLHEQTEYEPVLTKILTNNADMKMSLRARLIASVMHPTPTGIITTASYSFLNEVVVDHPEHMRLSKLTCLCDQVEFAHVQADGVIICTPTGSTAYNLSAGGPLLHQSVNGITMTLLAPHTLASRPIIFPSHSVLEVHVPDDCPVARATIDGRPSIQLNTPDFVRVEQCPYPVPSVCKDDEDKDWVHSLVTVLSWNQRK
ncbi:NAD kinase [Pelomyxa schiedti]|nr:NAD kinase [Pelomyxa schiedti]